MSLAIVPSTPHATTPLEIREEKFSTAESQSLTVCPVHHGKPVATVGTARRSAE